MFQQRYNELFSSGFDIDEQTPKPARFVTNCPNNTWNIYTDWLDGWSEFDKLDFKLQALAYNSAFNAKEWKRDEQQQHFSRRFAAGSAE